MTLTSITSGESPTRLFLITLLTWIHSNISPMIGQTMICRLPISITARWAVWSKISKNLKRISSRYSSSCGESMRFSKTRTWMQANPPKIKMKLRAFRVMIQLREADFRKLVHLRIAIGKIRADWSLIRKKYKSPFYKKNSLKSLSRIAWEK